MRAAARTIFGTFRFAAGHIDDQFGGELYYVYRVPRSEKPPSIGRDIARRFKSEAEQTAVHELLPRARADFQERLSDKLSEALGDLSIEVLWPLYQATGKKYRRRTTRHDSFDPDNPKVDRHEIAELKDGRIVRRRVNKFERGPNVRITNEKLEAAFRALGGNASQKTIAAHLGVSAGGLRKWQKGQRAERWKDVADYYRTCATNEN